MAASHTHQAVLTTAVMAEADIPEAVAAVAAAEAGRKSQIGKIDL